jgi:hypothetical protein
VHTCTQVPHVRKYIQSKSATGFLSRAGLRVQRIGQMEERQSLGVQMPDYLSTHPATEGRVQEARERARAAARLWELSNCGEKRSTLGAAMNYTGFTIEREYSSLRL